MEIYLIVAHAQNLAIGKDNKMLWHLPKDLRNFKELTEQQAVIMGRKTYESLGKWKPLPDRANIIITRNTSYVPDNANRETFVFHNLKDAVLFAENRNDEKLFIAGGGEIYRQALEQKDFDITGAYITEVHATVEGDTFFPDIRNIWGPVNRQVLVSHTKDDKHFADFDITLYTKQEIASIH